jgi:hypothetical protein
MSEDDVNFKRRFGKISAQPVPYSPTAKNSFTMLFNVSSAEKHVCDCPHVFISACIYIHLHDMYK